jgi:hypothetical protein
VTGAPALLYRHWVHAREEDRTGVRVFRPDDYPLPPARGRDGIEFRPDGTARAYGPGPVDAPVDRPPLTWAAEPDGTLVVRSADDESRYDIVTLTTDVLELSRHTPGPIPRPPR